MNEINVIIMITIKLSKAPKRAIEVPTVWLRGPQFCCHAKINQ